MTDSGEEPTHDETTAEESQDRVERPSQAPASNPTFGLQGWVLVAVIAICFLVIPGAILYLPAAEPLIESLGLTLRDAYLTLPLIPAFLLATVAVWTAVESRRQ